VQQAAQIGQMQGWLVLWDAPSQATGGYMRWMPATGDGMAMDHAAMRSARMPGMASPEDLAQLRSTPGAGADALFLQLMLRHHEGGVSMLQYAARWADRPQVANLATQMLTAQTTESQLMRQMLADRGSSPLPS
jgi:uncharacterized protein (DUF305 family)